MKRNFSIPKWYVYVRSYVDIYACAKRSCVLSLQCECGEQGACMEEVFTHNYTMATKFNLTYSQLINYYNEFVLQLKLAENNLEVAIDLEIQESNRSESMEKERNIIKSLNESILPALEYTVSAI